MSEFQGVLLSGANMATTGNVKRGAWINSEIPGERFKCSVCGGACWNYDYQGNVVKSNFCPNCGAKMDLNTSDNQWIHVKDRLPKNGQTVIIFSQKINVARFVRGISKEERREMKLGQIGDQVLGESSILRSNLYYPDDEDGNNKVPYHWVAPEGPMKWFGQEVSHWCPLPRSPKL